MTPEDLEQIRAIVHSEITSEIAEAKAELKAEIAEVKAEIKASEERSQEFARDLQTEILTGLQQFARGNFARMHTLEGNQADINVRLAALEERVLYLETRRRPQ